MKRLFLIIGLVLIFSFCYAEDYNAIKNITSDSIYIINDTNITQAKSEMNINDIITIGTDTGIFYSFNSSSINKNNYDTGIKILNDFENVNQTQQVISNTEVDYIYSNNNCNYKLYRKIIFSASGQTESYLIEVK